jgi:hypothetical protein
MLVRTALLVIILAPEPDGFYQSAVVLIQVSAENRKLVLLVHKVVDRQTVDVARAVRCSNAETADMVVGIEVVITVGSYTRRP